MKKIVLFLAIIFSLIACDNTLNLVEEGADVSIVYSLLSAGSNEQIVRLERGFIDPVKPATEIAQDPDEVYYPNATVKLRNLTTGNTFDLERIASSEINRERDNGFFLTDPNYIYYYQGEEDDFDYNQEVEVVVSKDETSDPITAKVNLLDELLVIRPKSGSNFDFPTEAQYKVQWVKSDLNPGKEYTITMKFYYTEADLSDEEPEFEEKVLNWNFTTVQDELFAEVPGIEFYKLFGNNLEKKASLVREFLDYDVIINYSGVEMEKFQNFLNANTGITSSQPLPPYTNLSSGLGLVAERERWVIDNVFIGLSTKDSLRMGRFTKDLNFQ